MEYLFWIVPIILIALVVWYKKREGNPTKEENEAIMQSVSRREDTFLTRTSDKTETQYNGKPSAPPTRQVRGDIRPTTPPPPPMRAGKSAPITTYVPPAPLPTTQSSGSGLLDLALMAVVLDAVIPDTVPEAKASYVDVPYDHGTPSAPERMPDPTPSYVEPDRTDYGSSSSDSGWSSSDSGSSSSWGD